MSSALIHVTFSKGYRYKGWLFEYDRNKPFVPEPLKKDGTPRKRSGRVFYEMFDEFYKLPIEEQEKYREF
jgi:hypothetical protein